MQIYGGYTIKVLEEFTVLGNYVSLFFCTIHNKYSFNNILTCNFFIVELIKTLCPGYDV